MKYEYIDKEELFLKNGINIVYGDKCTGKTTSVIKALNRNSIEPIVLDYDNNPRIEGLKYINVPGSKEVIEDILNLESNHEVIIIDHLDGFANGDYMSEERASIIIDILKGLREKHTVILLAHATMYRSATRVSYAFRGNDKIPNNADTVYSLNNKATLVIEKRRGTAKADINNWMRG